MSLTLEPGDVLYFPRGTVHQAKTTKDQHSLHLTISTYQRTCFADLLEQVLPEALRRAASQNVEFRQGLPLQYLKHFGLANRFVSNTPLRVFVTEKIKDLIGELITPEVLDHGADLLGKKLMYDSMPPLPYQSEKYRMVHEDGERLENGEVVNRWVELFFSGESTSGLNYFS